LRRPDRDQDESKDECNLQQVPRDVRRHGMGIQATRLEVA